MRQKYLGKDIQDRLHGTVIRYQGHPYLCQVSDFTSVIALHDLLNGNLAHKVSPTDDDLDISSINIGFVNINEPEHRLAVYLKREPTRRFKQGIEFSQLTQKVLKNGAEKLHSTKLSCRGFVDSVLGIYPSFKEAQKMLKSGWASVAISRDIAIKDEGTLWKVYLKDDEVGYMSPSSLVVNVPKTDLSWYTVYLLESIKEWTVVEGVK